MNDLSIDLRGKAAVVTGASSGIGKAIALALGERGVRLVLVGRDGARLSQIEAESRPSAESVRIVTGDLEVREEIRAVGSRIDELLDRVDVLVHAAGTIHLGPLGGVPDTVAEAMFNLNFWAPCLLTEHLLSKILQARGQLVFINSSVTHQPGKPELGYYSATKHALKAFCASLRAEVNPRGVRVLSVYPGKTASPMQERLYRAKGQVYRAADLLQPEDVALSVVQALTLPPTAEVTDLFIRPMEGDS